MVVVRNTRYVLGAFVRVQVWTVSSLQSANLPVIAHCGTVRVPTQRSATARVLVLAPRGGSMGAWGDRARSVATALQLRIRTVQRCAVLLCSALTVLYSYILTVLVSMCS